MTEPTASLHQRTAELQQQADQAMKHLQERIAGVRAAQQQALGVTGEAASKDGAVRAVTDATGVVTSLTFSPSVFERTTPERLAQTVVATLQEAAARARGRMAEAMSELRGDDTVKAAEQGATALGVPRLPVPEVPRTAVDPTAQDNWTNSPPPPAEPNPVRATSNRTRRTTDEDDDGAAGSWVSDERPW